MATRLSDKTMELWRPDQIALNETTNALIEDVAETARRVNEHRPFPEEVVRRINYELLGERVYSSNAIEGNTLELRETRMILEKGISGVKKKREAKEARNLGEAIKRVANWIEAEAVPYDVDRFLEIHKLILQDIKDEWAGELRTQRVMIHGAKHQPPNHALVGALLERGLDFSRQPGETGALVNAAWVHWAIARIHPFMDGNGRVARLWQDFVLLRRELTCAIIRPEDRRHYLDALGDADAGEFNPLVQLTANPVAATFDRYLVELGRTAAFEEWVTEVAGEVDERASEKALLAYTRWKRKMEQVRQEFELCAAKVSGASKRLRIQVERYPVIDQTQWQNIRDGIGAERTWFFRVDFASGDRRVRYYFFFGKHFWRDLDDERERAEQRVSLLISEDSGTGEAERLDKLEDCPITIREIFVVDDRLVCRNVDAGSSEARHERDVSALRIAQDFIREVALTRLT